MNYKICTISLVTVSIHLSFGVTQQEKLNRKLLKAVRNNKQTKVKSLLHAGADSNTHDTRLLARECSGYTPLHYAVHYNYKELAQLLLKYGAHVDSTDNTQHTPLHYAARDHKTDFVDLLLSHNAFVDAQNALGETPLHMTFSRSPFARATSAQYATVELLLSYGANINAQSHDGYTALHHTSTLGLSLIAELLLVHGANVTLQDKQGADTLFRTLDGKTILLLLNFGATDKHWENPEKSASAQLAQTVGAPIGPLDEVKLYYTAQKTMYQDLFRQIGSKNREAFTKAIEEGYYTLVKLFIRNNISITVSDLLLAKTHYILSKKQTNIYKHNYKAIGRLIFAYLQLLGIHCKDNTTNRTLLSRISSRASIYKKSLIGPIAKKGIIDSNCFTEDIVRTIARYL